jgi:predicted transcriptional regulator YdeE
MTNGFKLVGISTRTTNKDNKSAQDLSKLWDKFYSENVLQKVQNKVSNKIISTYTDYKSDYTEDYTNIIGFLVSTLDDVPNGLVGREFQAENFQKFIAIGELPNAVLNTWVDIWQRDEELKRKYTYDFEVYGEKSQDGENAEVEIYIAIK